MLATNLVFNFLCCHYFAYKCSNNQTFGSFERIVSFPKNFAVSVVLDSVRNEKRQSLIVSIYPKFYDTIF